MRLTTLISTLALTLSSSFLTHSMPVHRRAVSTPCVAGRTAARVGFWTWPAKSEVKVYLRDPDFSAAYSAAVAVALTNWDAVAAENGSNVHFSFRGLTSETKTARGEVTIIRGEVFTKKEKHLALLKAHSLSNDQLIDYAIVVVDYRVSNPKVLTNLMAHEIGHSLGLADCYECSSGSTAMGLMKTATEPNGIEGPTTCDSLAVRTAYRELATRAIQFPARSNDKAADDGEEPEADDTPIIKRPR
ncbi:MAG: hypothetical protein ACXW18_00935 [Pyrinomonadaceae bacterium]